MDRITPPALALILILIGCSHPKPEGRDPEVGLFMYDRQAKKVLDSMGIERDPVSVVFRPMAYNRLDVTLGSRNPEVADLTITLVDLGNGWQLEGPWRDVISTWLERSDRK